MAKSFIVVQFICASVMIDFILTGHDLLIVIFAYVGAVTLERDAVATLACSFARNSLNKSRP